MVTFNKLNNPMKKPTTKPLHWLVILLVAFSFSSCVNSGTSSNIQFEFPTDHYSEALDGRMIVLISENNETEPRFQLRDDSKTCQAFGMDVEDWQPGEALELDGDAYGYPVQSVEDLPSGEFYVQVLFHKYETFNRADGKVVKLPMDRGEGQQWNRAPGNLYSTPQKVSIKNGQLPKLSVNFDQKIPPIKEAEDTKYVKHIKIKSKLLSEFWGRDMYLGAHVLLPEGWESHPNVKYPLAIMHGHFPSDFGGFSTTPPDPNLKPEYSERFDVDGYNLIVQQEAHDFYKT